MVAGGDIGEIWCRFWWSFGVPAPGVAVRVASYSRALGLCAVGHPPLKVLEDRTSRGRVREGWFRKPGFLLGRCLLSPETAIFSGNGRSVLVSLASLFRTVVCDKSPTWGVLQFHLPPLLSGSELAVDVEHHGHRCVRSSLHHACPGYPSLCALWWPLFCGATLSPPSIRHPYVAAHHVLHLSPVCLETAVAYFFPVVTLCRPPPPPNMTGRDRGCS